MIRPTHDEYFLAIAGVVATRATCLRRAAGCVLVDARGHVLATGYNGRPSGCPHCNELTRCVPLGQSDQAIPAKLIDTWPHVCAGVLIDGKLVASGTNLDACEAIHAEQNALLQCSNIYNIETCYVTVSPCLTCVKLLLNTNCKRVVFAIPYAHDEIASRLWTAGGRIWKLVK